MSETQQSDAMRQRLQAEHDPDTPQTNEIVLNDTATMPTYANFCQVTATPEELLLDLGLNSEPFAAGRREVKANPKIAMTFFTAKRLMAALGLMMQRHERSFGVIELDIARRAGKPQHQLTQAAAVPAGKPEVIRLAR